jgi:hypothetical protein
MRNVATMKQPLLGTLIFASLLFAAGPPAKSLAQPLEVQLPSRVSATQARQAQLLPQIRIIEGKTRFRMLAALSPAHLALLSGVIGELAIEQSPDIDNAAKRLNAALSPAEKRNVLAAESYKIAAVHKALNDMLTPKRQGFRSSPSYMRRAEAVDAGLALIRSVMVIRASEKKQ